MAEASLALQAEYLYHRIEWHLLGNHLFENARALVLAGMFFEGEIADKWRAQGAADTGCASSMSRCSATAGISSAVPCITGWCWRDLLDLVQVGEWYGMNGTSAGRWRQCCADMLGWLRAMSHPDGGISFFNDAAFDVCLSPAALEDYARRLNIDAPGPELSEGVTLLEESGYVRVSRGPMVALLDVAPLGPDYLPGHGHADTLSFELSVDGQRVLVNSGTGVYGVGEERLRQRGTAAHNTVEVDGENSSEVWGGFRVARRARPFDVSAKGHGEVWQVRGSHDGYRRLPGGVTHRRTWLISESELTVEDELFGGFGSAVAYFHFHPGVEVTFDGSRGEVVLAGGRRVGFVVLEGEGALGESAYHPEFGMVVANRCLGVTIENSKCRVVFKVG